MNERRSIVAIKVLVAVMIGVISFFWLAPLVPQSNYIQESLEHLNDDEAMVAKVSTATIGTSFAISVLPDDVGSPVANTLADMNKFLLGLMVVIFVERLIVVEGIKIAFVYIIPIACSLIAVSKIPIKSIQTTREMMSRLGIRLIILGMAIVCVIPFSTHFTRAVGADYLAYVDETVEKTSAGMDQVTGVDSESEQEKSVLDKLKDKWDSAVNGVSEAITYIKGGVTKFANAIAVLIVTTFVIPLLILFFFRWLLNQLFSISLPLPHFKRKASEPLQS